ncbi:MAG: SpoIID/LytB domain-containing protein [Synechococcales bacterium]|nr:SpoIID/LytB domain-containing protein [Synechococcales bacterium]
MQLHPFRPTWRVARLPVALSLCMMGAMISWTPAQASPNKGQSVASALPPKIQTKSAVQTAKPLPEPVLEVGIVQRFGEQTTDRLTIAPQPGDRLTIQLETGGQEETLVTDQVKLEIVMEPLPEPEVVERVVLSNHRSFESAEDSANRWRAQGIDVEIAQPNKWQVWAKRDVYNTPLLRRLLIQNLKSHGVKTAFLDSTTLQARPQAAILVNGFRYHRDEVEITSGRDRIWVNPVEDQHRRLYGGDLRLQPNAYGTYTLVNDVPIETYLRGVVPHEIGLGAPPTTIEAQSVLARTYALRNLRRFEIDNYELCADTQCQVYWGLGGASEISDRAIAATQGKVLTYQDELVDALYSSTTGGVTAPFSHVWNGPDRTYLTSVVDSVGNIWDLSRKSLDDETNFRQFIDNTRGFNEEGWDAFRWRIDHSLTDIARDVRAYLEVVQHPMVSFTKVEKLEVVERATSGRIQKLEVTTDLGVVELEKDEIIRALYPPRSTLFYLDPIYEEVPAETPADPLPTDPVVDLTLEPAPGSADPAEVVPPVEPPTRVLKGYTFVGGGWGHGVGMSQTGAYKLGELGWSSDRILSFYYPGSQLETLHDQIVFWRDPEPQP